MAIPWKWPTECFKPHCGHEFMDRNFIFQQSLTKKIESKNSWQYLENDPLNVLNLIVDMNLWIEISFSNKVWPKKNRKKNKISWQYLENDPLNVLNLIVDWIYG